MTAKAMIDNAYIAIQRLGDDFRRCTEIVEAPLEGPGPGEVLIRHHYAGVNGVYDQMMCLDRVEHTRVEPPAPTGVEAVGRVAAIGQGVENFTVGDPVATVRAGTGYRLWQCVPEAEVIAVPEVAPWVLAIVPSGVSALVALEQVAELGSGETVLVTAAAGGLGHVMTQLAVRAGNHVVAVCGSKAKAAWLTAAGVDRVVNYREESLDDVLAADYADRLDLVMDSVGGATFDALVEQLAPRGRLVVCGYSSDRLPTARPAQERIYTRLYWKAASVRGFMNWRFAEHAAEARARLFQLVAAGEIDALVDREHFRGLEAVPDAVEHLLAGRNLGKVVVDLSPGSPEPSTE